jgi:uncharacterized protein
MNVFVKAFPAAPKTLSVSTPEAVSDSERAEVLDALRAFALLGILISHVPDFTGYNFLAAPQRALLDPLGIDPTVSAWLVLIIREKFVSLFSLLFGIGFAVQLDSSARQGAAFRWRFGRRLGALFIMGAIHAAIWYGDILKDYAVLGLALLLASQWPLRRIAIAAAVLFLARLAWPLLFYSVFTAVGHSNVIDAPDQAFADGVTDLSKGFTAFFLANLQLVKLKALQMFYEGRFITILTMFFIGAWIGKVKLYRNLPQHRKLLVRVLAVCAPIGILADAALIPFEHATNVFPPTHDWVAFQSLVAIAAPALCLAYASAFALAWLALNGRFLRRIAPIGRTALSSYISQTLICTVAFVWFGLGHNLGATGCLIAAVVIFTIQCVLARTWLQYFRFGPLEWIWRCATYAEWIEIRRPGISAASASPS